MNIIREIQKKLFPKTLKCVYRRDILKYALKHNHDQGVCCAIWRSLEHYNLALSIDWYLPLANFDNAKRFKANRNYGAYWWPLSDWTNRIEYLQWLFNQYKDDKTNLKKL